MAVNVLKQIYGSKETEAKIFRLFSGKIILKIYLYFKYAKIKTKIYKYINAFKARKKCITELDL